MTSSIFDGRRVDAVHLTKRSPAGTRFGFQQRVDEVARIERPLSPALAQGDDTNFMKRLTDPLEASQKKVDRLNARMRGREGLDVAPPQAETRQEYDYQVTMLAKSSVKVTTGIQTIVNQT